MLGLHLALRAGSDLSIRPKPGLFHAGGARDMGPEVRGERPQRVKSAVSIVRRSFPVFPDKRKFLESVGMSRICHQPTFRRIPRSRGRARQSPSPRICPPFQILRLRHRTRRSVIALTPGRPLAFIDEHSSPVSLDAVPASASWRLRCGATLWLLRRRPCSRKLGHSGPPGR